FSARLSNQPKASHLPFKFQSSVLFSILLHSTDQRPKPGQTPPLQFQATQTFGNMCRALWVTGEACALTGQITASGHSTPVDKTKFMQHGEWRYILDRDCTTVCDPATIRHPTYEEMIADMDEPLYHLVEAFRVPDPEYKGADPNEDAAYKWDYRCTRCTGRDPYTGKAKNRR
ncbi:hypothetical protein K505DRAFT_389819, partial [Melanomma pulvis-pyrius CBS 109.77]